MTEAAEAIGFHPQTVFRALRDDPELKEQVVEARELKRLRKGERAETIIWQVADDPGHKDRLRAAEKLAETFNDDFRPARRDPEEDRSDSIAEALDRFTATVVSLAAGGRAELPPGGTE